MFNVTVLRKKDIFRYIVRISILISIILFSYNSITNKNFNLFIDKNISVHNINIESSMISNIIKNTISSFEIIKNQENENINLAKKSISEIILKSQISSIKVLETKAYEDFKESIENIADENINMEKDEINIAEINLPTEVITPNPLTEVFQEQYNNVKIKNETEYILTPEILAPDINIENKNILLFQTHTCESYTATPDYTYAPSGNYRTIDLNFSVAQVGEEFKKYLDQYGYNVYHDQTYHDYPSYNGSYTNSLKTVESILQTTPADIVIDIHRDAIGSITDYAPTVRIGDEEAAQIMFVVGTNSGGLWHPNWQQNLKFAIKVQEIGEEMYPGLFKPIFLTNSRYNQHTAKYATIIEVGATGNTLEQAMTSMKYLSKVLDEVLK